jgi:hypothetical protein
MPANPFNEYQAGNLVAYVRSMVGGARTGNGGGDKSLPEMLTRGKAIYEGKGPARRATRLMASARKAVRIWAPQRGGRGGGGGAPPLPVVVAEVAGAGCALP